MVQNPFRSINITWFICTFVCTCICFTLNSLLTCTSVIYIWTEDGNPSSIQAQETRSEENLLLIGKTTPIVSIDNDICNIIMLSLYTMESFLEQDTLTLLLSEWLFVVLTPNEQIFSYIMTRTSYIWWDVNNLLCTRPTCLVRFFSASSLNVDDDDYICCLMMRGQDHSLKIELSSNSQNFQILSMHSKAKKKIYVCFRSTVRP